MENQIKIGDVVTLKSGGPQMTVNKVIIEVGEESKFVMCLWFKGTTLKEGKFHTDSLQKI